MPRRIALGELVVELDNAEAVVALAELAADVEDRLIPSTAGRGLLPHERAAGVNYRELDEAVERLAEQTLRRLLQDRGDFLAIVDPHVRRHGLAWLAGDGPFDLPDVRRLIDEATAAHEATLRAAHHAGVSSAYVEAARQGLTPPALVAAPAGASAGAILVNARRMAAEPLQELRRRMVEAGRRAPALLAGVVALAGEDVSAALDAAREAPTAGLATDYARVPVANAQGSGRVDAGDRLPTPARIYASELLDSRTCGPCSMIDGREFVDEAEARLYYPGGFYVRCEGGTRCRGTLVRVWNTEAAPTVQGPLPPDPPTPIPPPPPPTPSPILPPAPKAPAVPLTREQAQAAERAARLEARRARAAEERAAEAEELAVLEADGYTAEQIAQARRDLDYYRERARASAARTAETMEAELGSLDQAVLGAPPRAVVRRRGAVGSRQGAKVQRVNADGTPYIGGEWDWYEGLAESEKKRLRRQWVGQPNGHAPDQLDAIYRDRWGTDDVDATLAKWLDLNRRADAARAVARGRAPSPTAYGNLDVDELVPDEPFDVSTLFGSDVRTAVGRILSRYDDEAARFADEALNAPPARLGPDPWDMTEDDFVRELNRIDEVYAANDVPVVDFDDTLGRPRYAPDVEEELARLAELVPAEFQELDVGYADLHRAIIQWADRAGLRTERFAA
jgi:hypothetical protein